MSIMTQELTQEEASDAFPMQQGGKQLRSSRSCVLTWLVKLILVMVSAYQLQLHGMASSYSQYSCDLVGSLHKGLQSRAISIVQVITS